MKKAILVLSLMLIGLFLFGCTENPPPQPACGADEYYDSGFCVSFLNMTEQESKTFLRNEAYPFGLTDWKFNESNELEVTIKNKSNESLKVLVFEVGLKQYNSNAYTNLTNDNILTPKKIYEDVAGIGVSQILEPDETTTIIVDKIFIRENRDDGYESSYEGPPKGICSAIPRLDFIPLISYENNQGTTQTQKEKTPLIISC